MSIIAVKFWLPTNLHLRVIKNCWFSPAAAAVYQLAGTLSQSVSSAKHWQVDFCDKKNEKKSKGESN